MLKLIFSLLFRYKVHRLNPGWRSVIILTAPTKAECNDLAQIVASLPAKHIGETPIVAVRSGCDITEIKHLPEDLLQKIREAIW